MNRLRHLVNFLGGLLILALWAWETLRDEWDGGTLPPREE